MHKFTIIIRDKHVSIFSSVYLWKTYHLLAYKIWANTVMWYFLIVSYSEYPSSLQVM